MKIELNVATMPAAEITRQFKIHKMKLPLEGVTAETIDNCRLMLRDKFIHMLKG